ncbi:MAG TPA: hypothetical protein VFA00_15695 [Actinomycetota bacterium]|nr:hypothetical protein [Actinomycetota bacterium]
MRSAEEWELVTRWIAWGLNDCQIARLTGIPRTTVRDWRHLGREPGAYPRRGDCPVCNGACIDAQAYSYLLGLYLGDGHISSHSKGVFKLRIFLDDRYPNIIKEAGDAMRRVRPSSSMSVIHVSLIGCTEVCAYWKHWPCLFPQHGPGMKHTRSIKLRAWQRDIVVSHPELFLRGLIHSDGYRGLNWVNGKGYPRYQFTNHSDDSRGLFCWACDLLEIPWRRMNRYNISVARRAAVARMDEFIGPKT